MDKCPVCGREMDERKQVCDDCEEVIPWGANISDYAEIHIEDTDRVI